MTGQDTLIAILGAAARKAAFSLSEARGSDINAALNLVADTLISGSKDILAANRTDVQSGKDNNLTDAMIDRLTLSADRITAMAKSVRDIAALPDPCGDILEEWVRPNGLRIQKVSVPIGVLGMIYESRPNVTIDAAALCLKSRNAVILRGGSECFQTHQVLHGIVQTALRETGITPDAVLMVNDADRRHVGDMLAAHEYIDVMIPRGGKGLTQRVMREARMPVFAHLDGNCHVYVHDSAKADVAVQVVLNAKMRRTGICGAAESLLFDSTLSPETARRVINALLDSGCSVVGDAKTMSLEPRIEPAVEDDWKTEYLSPRISCKFVDGVKDAVNHINMHGSHHTDSILAEDAGAVDYFTRNVDSAIVMHNASTQFADGGEFGMGAEIGIGTGKLHARGPVGARQLTTFKYIVHGTGQVRA